MKVGGGDEFVILASDGVWDSLSSAKAVHFVRRSLKESACATVPFFLFFVVFSFVFLAFLSPHLFVRSFRNLSPVIVIDSAPGIHGERRPALAY